MANAHQFAPHILLPTRQFIQRGANLVERLVQQHAKKATVLDAAPMQDLLE